MAKKPSDTENQGNHEDHNDHMTHEKHDNHDDHEGHDDHQNHHAHMVADFRRRFWVSVVFSIPVVVLAPLIQGFLGVKEAWNFAGDAYVQFGFATVVFIYGGKPFFKRTF